jgi:hypothetical protein
MWQLELKRYFFPETFVKARKEHISCQSHEAGKCPEFEITLAYGVNKAEKQVLLNLTLTSIDLVDEDPYEFKIEVFGSFFLTHSEGVEELDAEFFEIKKKIVRNCAQILVGSIRDHLLTITAKAPFGPIYLDTTYIGLDNIPDEPEDE